MSTAKPTYVSSSGTLASQPITSRIRNWTGDYVTLVYLFFETLITVSSPQYIWLLYADRISP